MEHLVYLENIPVELDMPAVRKKLGIRDGQDKFVQRLDELAEMVLEKAHPRAIACLSPVEVVNEGLVRVNGVDMASTLLAEKFSGLGRVFPFLATEGVELAAWAESLDSSLDLVFAGALRQSVCKQYQALLEQKIQDDFGIPIVSCVQPGSLPVWPIEQQVQLFQALAPCQEKVGVTLLPSHLMAPAYSVSGIYFQTDKKYYNCMLCPRENCPNRKAKSQVI